MSKQEIEGEMSIVFKIDGVTWTPEQVESLLETIWPGKPQWEPTPEHPQQSFHEAIVQSKDQRIEVLERHLDTYEKGICPQIIKILDEAKVPIVVDGMSLRLDERVEYAWEQMERKLTVAREALYTYANPDNWGDSSVYTDDDRWRLEGSGFDIARKALAQLDAAAGKEGGDE